MGLILLPTCQLSQHSHTPSHQGTYGHPPWSQETLYQPGGVPPTSLLCQLCPMELISEPSNRKIPYKMFNPNLYLELCTLNVQTKIIDGRISHSQQETVEREALKIIGILDMLWNQSWHCILQCLDSEWAVVRPGMDSKTEGSSPRFSFRYKPTDHNDFNVIKMESKWVPFWKSCRIWFYQDSCPLVLHFKPQGVGTIYKVICSSFQEKSFLDLAFEDELVKESILTMLSRVLRSGWWYHGLVVLLLRWRKEIVRLEGGDQGSFIIF